MKKLFFAIAMLLCVCVCMGQRPHKVPASPHPISVTQPNGDSLTIRLIGDERMHYSLTEDGYLIDQNKKGYYCYAKYRSNGDIKVTHRKAHNADARSKCESRYIEKNIPKKHYRGEDVLMR